MIIHVGREGVKRGAAGYVRRLKTGWSGRVFGGTRGHRERGVSCLGPFRTFDPDGVWVVEKLYNVVFESVECLLDFTMPLRPVKRVIGERIRSGHDRHRQ